MIETIVFYIFGTLALALGICTIAFRNPIHSAVSLIFNLFCVAVLFGLLKANFISVVQVMVYAGAILVLFIFVIMLLNLSDKEIGSAKRRGYHFVALLLVLSFIFFMAVLILSSKVGDQLMVSQTFGTLESMGIMLFGRYLLPFEVASAVLLAAILGAVAIAKKEIW